MDALVLKERIRKTIELGESQFREFKSAYHGEPGAKKPRETSSVSKDIAEALVAFANADGGELLVGVEDDGSVTGIPFSDKQVVPSARTRPGSARSSARSRPGRYTPT